MSREVAETLREMADQEGATPDTLAAFLLDGHHARDSTQAREVAHAAFAQRTASSSESEESSDEDDFDVPPAAKDWLASNGQGKTRADCVKGLQEASGGRLSAQDAGSCVDEVFLRVPTSARDWLSQNAAGKTMAECVDGLVQASGGGLSPEKAALCVSLELGEVPPRRPAEAGRGEGSGPALKPATIKPGTQLGPMVRQYVLDKAKTLPQGLADDEIRQQLAQALIDRARDQKGERLEPSDARRLVDDMPGLAAGLRKIEVDAKAAEPAAKASQGTHAPEAKADKDADETARAAAHAEPKAKPLSRLTIDANKPIGPNTYEQVRQLSQGVPANVENRLAQVAAKVIDWEASRGIAISFDSAKILIERVEAQEKAKAAADTSAAGDEAPRPEAEARPGPAPLRPLTIDADKPIGPNTYEQVRQLSQSVPAGADHRLAQVAAKVIDWEASRGIAISFDSAKILIERVEAQEKAKASAIPGSAAETKTETKASASASTTPESTTAASHAGEAPRRTSSVAPPLDRHGDIDVLRMGDMVLGEVAPTADIVAALHDAGHSAPEIFRSLRSPAVIVSLRDSVKAMSDANLGLGDMIGALLEVLPRHSHERGLRMLMSLGHAEADIRDRLVEKFGYSPDRAGQLAANARPFRMT